MKETLQLFVTIFTLSTASMAIAVTLSKGKIFRAQRLWIRSKSSWIGQLMSCPYCLCHWIVAVVTLMYRPCLLHSSVPFVDLAISLFCIIGITAFEIGILLSLFHFEPDPTSEELDTMEKLRNALVAARKTIEDQKKLLEKS
jgi:hypothetical protein